MLKKENKLTQITKKKKKQKKGNNQVSDIESSLSVNKLEEYEENMSSNSSKKDTEPKYRKTKQDINQTDNKEESQTKLNKTSTKECETKDEESQTMKNDVKNKKHRKKKHKYDHNAEKNVMVDTTENKMKKEANVGKAKQAAIEYLRLWKSDRNCWNFQKVRQIWLLQNMYEIEKLDNSLFPTLLEYLEGLKGKARDETLKKAGNLLSSNSENSSDEDKDNDSEQEKPEDAKAKLKTKVSLDRVRQVIQLLT